MINKRTLLIVSGAITILLFAWNYVGNYRLCDLLTANGSASECPFILTGAGMNLLPIIPLFLLSLITYKMRDEVYLAWVRFAYVWIPLSLIAILLAPQYSSDWMYPIVKGTVAFSSSILFVIISIIIIAWKYFSTRKG